jgi:hypothetical protein
MRKGIEDDWRLHSPPCAAAGMQFLDPFPETNHRQNVCGFRPTGHGFSDQQCVTRTLRFVKNDCSTLLGRLIKNDSTDKIFNFSQYIFNMWQYLDHRLYWTCVLFVFSWRRTMNMNASQVAEVLGCNYPVACLSMGSPKSPWYGTWWYTMGLQGCHFFKSYHCSRFLVLLSSWIFGGFRINCAIKSAVPAVS